MRWPLPTQSYRRVSSERLVNCYAQAKPQDGYGPVALVRAPGIETLVSLGSEGRGLHVFGDGLYAVAGNSLFKVTGTDSATNLGAVIGSGRVKMSETFDKLAILNGDGQLFLSDGGPPSQVLDADFRVASDMDFLDNYLVFTEAYSGRWFSSNVAAPDTYDALMFATAEGQPDQLTGLIADHGQAFLAGLRSCELWQNTGGTGFPFARIDNGLIEIGCAAGRSLAKIDNSILWLANDLTVRRLDGFTPVRISTDGVEAAIRGYGDVTGAYAFAYTFAGHLMYTITFPGLATWEFDITTGLWHERISHNSSTWNVVGVTQFGNDVYTIDGGGRVGVLRSSVYTEYGETQRVEFVCAPMYAEANRLFLRRAELLMRTGSA